MANKKPHIQCPYCHVYSQQETYEYHFPIDEKKDEKGVLLAPCCAWPSRCRVTSWAPPARR